jgi:hypothetical protein
MSPSFQAQGALVALNDVRTRESTVAVIRTSAAGHGLAAMLTWQPFIH